MNNQGFGFRFGDIHTIIFLEDKIRVDVVDYFSISSNEILLSNIKSVTYKKPSLFGKGSIFIELIEKDENLHRYAHFMLVFKNQKFEAETVMDKFQSLSIPTKFE